MNIKFKNREFVFSVSGNMISSENVKAYLGATHSAALLKKFVKAESTTSFFLDVAENEPRLSKNMCLIIANKRKSFTDEWESVLPAVMEHLQNPELKLKDLEYNSFKVREMVVLKLLSEHFDKIMRYFAQESEENQEEEPFDEKSSFSQFAISHKDNLLSVMAGLYLFEHLGILNVNEDQFQQELQQLELFINTFLLGVTREDIERALLEKIAMIKGLDTELASKSKIIETKKKEYIKQGEQLFEANQNIKVLQKELKNISKMKYDEQLKQYQDEVAAKEKELSDYKLESIAKKEYDNIKELYQTLKEKQLQKNAEMVNLKKRLDHYEKYSFEEQVETYLKGKGLTDDLMQIIHPYYQDYMEGKKPNSEFSSSELVEQLGYCVVRENIHYICNAQGIEKRINNLPKECYLGIKQFIKVDQDMNYLCRYDYCKNVDEMEVAKSGIASGGRDKVLITNFNLVDGKIVGVDSNHETVTYYKYQPFRSDTHMKSVSAKGHKAYLVYKSIAEGQLVFDIENQKDSFVQLESQAPINDYTIVFVEGKTVLTSYASPIFHTGSKHYTKSETVHINEMDGSWFFNRTNNERILLKGVLTEIPIQDGDIVKIDEFGSLIEVLNSDKVQRMDSRKSQERRILSHKAREDKQVAERGEPQENDVIIDRGTKVTIVGNTKLFSSYQFAFIREGYDIAAVDGFESWHKISKEAKDSNVIVFVTEHASHENYYHCKETFADKDIIYSDRSGVNHILDRVKEVS